MEDTTFSATQVQTIWQQVCARLESQLSPAVFNTWISSNPLTRLEPQESGRLRATISSPTAFHASNLKKNLQPTIQEAIQDVIQHPCDIQYVIEVVQTGSKKPTATKKTRVNSGFQTLTTNLGLSTPQGTSRSVSSPTVEDLFSESTISSVLADRIDLIARRIGLRSDYTFDQFAVSTSNEMAHAAATAVAKKPGQTYNPLFLYGGVGVGKTHLMHAIGNHLLTENPQLKIIYCSGEEFTNEIVSAIQTKKARLFKQKYRSADLLLIDDIQFIAGKNAVQEEFFHTFNALTKSQKQVVLTSDKPPQDIQLLEDRLRSRFQAGLMIDIGQPSFELRTAIVLVKSKNHNLNLTIDMAKQIAGAVESARKIEGLITTIRSEVELKEREVNEDLLKDVLKTEIAFKRQPLLAKPTDVIKRVASHFQLKQSLVRGKQRKKHIVRARHLAMFILKEDVQLPLAEIGSWFSGRDHTTVLHAVNKIHTQLEDDPQLQRDLAEIRTSFVG